jgi:hypothetical protein
MFIDLRYRPRTTDYGLRTGILVIPKPSKLQPALLGGLVLGLGSVIPGVSYGNLCCCGWAIVGGALAAYLLIRRSPMLPITKADGARAGALAGVVGSGIYLLIGVPLSLLQWSSVVAQMQERSDTIDDAATRQMFKQVVATMQDHPVAIALVVWLIFAIAGIGMAALGGVLGAAIFEKRKVQQYPPQPPPPPVSLPPGYAPPGPPPDVPQPPGQAPYEGTEPPSN